ncbi:hypothetical protein [Moorena sp. SIO4G3]|uniref:hypothetical protein n=1 Tax=Moorena sp. SIO4G3 TaxID=2607821 RepID=UPI00142A3FEE|nr:hypothetical protein [Moorena sp. SIO4G3]NEO77089.1 hypothetical protein [Moorena sp. SIO4G3]
MPIAYCLLPGCISFLLFDPVVRYGVGYFNGGEEAENQGQPTPNAPYAKFTIGSMPIAFFSNCVYNPDTNAL